MKPQHHIQVGVRIRPPSSPSTTNISHISTKKSNDIERKLNFESEGRTYSFDFNHIFEENASQKQIHEEIGIPQLDDLFQGFNTTIFAYGQTGSGKTYTMYGDSEEWNAENMPESSGLVPRLVSSMFERIGGDASSSSSSSKLNESNPSSTEEIYYTIRCTFLEVYNNTVRDLLVNPGKRESKRALNVRETPARGVWIDGLTEEFVASVKDVAELVRFGLRRRAVKATKMNDYSSRSHCVFTIRLEQNGFSDGTSKSSCLNLVDLAGSERIRRTGVEKSELKEACNINQSLSCLGSCIHALTESNRSHIPYRDSKLTHILKESLGGNSRTCLLTTISPDFADAQESLNSIRFGSIARSVKINARVNIRKSNAQLVAELETMRQIVSTLEQENDALREVVGEEKSSSSSSTSLKVDEEEKDVVPKLKIRCDVLESTVAALLAQISVLSSDLKTVNNAKLIAEKHLSLIRTSTKNSKAEAVQNLSSAWMKLREHENDLKEREDRFNREILRIRENERSNLSLSQVKLEQEQEIEEEEEDKVLTEDENVCSERKINHVAPTSSQSSSKGNEKNDQDEDNKLIIIQPKISSVPTKDFKLITTSFEELWEQANQIADLKMLSDADLKTSSQRPQSAFVRAKRLSSTLRMKRAELQENLKNLNKHLGGTSSSPLSRGKIVRVAGSRKIFIEKNDSLNSTI